MTKINVVQIVEDLRIGGLERVIENIAMHLNPEKFRISVLCLSKGGEIADRLTANGKEVEILGIKNYHSPLSILKVAKWLRQKKIDVVHTHGYPAGVLGRVAAIIARVPCIFHHIHGIYFYYTGRQIFIEKLLSKFTNTVVTCSDAAKEFMAEIFRLQPDKMITVYNGVYINKSDINSDRIRGEFNIPINCQVIGTIGRLEYIKGHEFLLKAAVEIEKAVPETLFFIIGEGSIKNKLEDLCRLLGLKNIIFTGKRVDISSLLSVMDLFVLPSISEGFGIAIVEAMAMGLPVVATKVGGVPEMVADGISGVLVPPEDQEALSQKIISLLKDREKAKKMGIVGKNIYLKRFTVEDMIQTLEILYTTYP